jgi:ADP-ribose pyrophosphatase YjhB (NUDIX family)
VVAGIVRDRTGRVLLVQAEDQGWKAPGGPVERGAWLVTALQRLIEEASGCRVKVGRLAGLYAERTTASVGFLFLCAHAGGELRPNERTSAVGWFAPDNALSLVTDAVHADQVRNALRPDADGVVHRLYQRHPYHVLRQQQLAVVQGGGNHEGTVGFPSAPDRRRSPRRLFRFRPVAAVPRGFWRRFLVPWRAQVTDWPTGA